jgi:hypothetical protein
LTAQEAAAQVDGSLAARLEAGFSSILSALQNLNATSSAQTEGNGVKVLNELESLETRLLHSVSELRATLEQRRTGEMELQNRIEMGATESMRHLTKQIGSLQLEMDKTLHFLQADVVLRLERLEAKIQQRDEAIVGLLLGIPGARSSEAPTHHQSNS